MRKSVAKKVMSLCIFITNHSLKKTQEHCKKLAKNIKKQTSKSNHKEEVGTTSNKCGLVGISSTIDS
jgi:hypothetical protein